VASKVLTVELAANRASGFCGTKRSEDNLASVTRMFWKSFERLNYFEQFPPTHIDVGRTAKLSIRNRDTNLNNINIVIKVRYFKTNTH